MSALVCPDGGGECDPDCDLAEFCDGPVPAPEPPVIERPVRASEWHEWGTMPRPQPFAWLGCAGCFYRMGNGVCSQDGGVAERVCVNFRPLESEQVRRLAALEAKP